MIPVPEPPVHGLGGKRLPAAVQARMEAFFGADFSDVRVHVSPLAAKVGALALTSGSDVYFAPGQYDPGSPRGERLLAHELAHVVQQRSGRVRQPPGEGWVVVHDPALEAEAERASLRVAHHAASRPPVRPGAGVSQPRLARLPSRTIQPYGSEDEKEEEESGSGSGRGGGRRKRKAPERYDAGKVQAEAQKKLAAEKERSKKRRQDRDEYVSSVASVKITPREGRTAIDNEAAEIHRRAWILMENGAPVRDEGGREQIDPHEREATTAVGLFEVYKGGSVRRIKLCAMQRRLKPSVDAAQAKGMTVCETCPGGLHIHAEAWMIYSAFLLWGYEWRCLNVGASQEFCMYCQRLLTRLGIPFDRGYVKTTGTDSWGDPWHHVSVSTGPSSWDDFAGEYLKRVASLPASAAREREDREEKEEREERKRERTPEISAERREIDRRWASISEPVRGGVDALPRPIPRPAVPVVPAARSWNAADVRARFGLGVEDLVADQEYRARDGTRYQYKGSYQGVFSLARQYSFQPL